MLRIDWQEGRLPTDFDDDYLELVHLLTEAAALEHALMIAYLYAAVHAGRRFPVGRLGAAAELRHVPGRRESLSVLPPRVHRRGVRRR